MAQIPFLGWRDRVDCKAFALYMTDLDSIPGTMSGPQTLPGKFPEHKAMSKPRVLLGMAPNQNPEPDVINMPFLCFQQMLAQMSFPLTRLYSCLQKLAENMTF